MTRSKSVRRVVGVLVGACASWLPALPTQAASSKVSPSRLVCPSPPWVDRIEVEGDAKVPEGVASGGVHYLLVDRQTRVTGGTRESFSHFAEKVVNEAGLSDAANISIEYEPSYQSLSLHFIRVYRGGKVTDRLSPSKLQVIQRESEMEYQLYDGTLSVVTLLEDVRVGDVVEYAFTVRGANPVFEGRYFGSFPARWGVPVLRQRWRLLWPTARSLHVRAHNTALKPSLATRGPETEYVWEERDIAPLVADSDTPGWFDADAWVQLSEFPTWGEVADWGGRRFARSGWAGPAIARKVAEIKKASATPDDAALAALRFVQDDVRYLGVEIGASSHQPNPPETVLLRRFGDCKDKAGLFCALIEGLGSSCQPVLVNTTWREGLEAWHPSPSAFNHAVARVEVSGHVYWLDPTLTAQGGSLERVVFPDYADGLVLAPGTSALTPLPRATLDAPSISARESYVLKGEDQAADLLVETRYEQGDADKLRRRLRRESREEIERAYLKFYAGEHRGTRQTAPLEVADDLARNVITTREHYSIPGFYGLAEDKSRRQFEVSASTVRDVLARPGGVSRKAPLAVQHPVNVRHVTDVTLPELIKVTPEDKEIVGRAERFSYRSTYEGRTLHLEYSYRSLAGSVSATDLQAHLRDLEHIDDLLHYRVTKSLSAAKLDPSRKRLVIGVAAIVTGIFVPALLTATVFAFRYRPAAPLDVPIIDPALVGLRGWLTLVGLGVFLSPLRLAGNIATSIRWYRPAVWEPLTSPGSSTYHALWGPLLLGELLGNVFFLVFSLVLLALFLQQRRTFPRFFVAFHVLNFLFVALDASIVHIVSPTATSELGPSAIPQLVFVGIWMCYLQMSQRSRATFTK